MAGTANGTRWISKVQKDPRGTGPDRQSCSLMLLPHPRGTVNIVSRAKGFPRPWPHPAEVAQAQAPVIRRMVLYRAGTG